jgi:arylsulfatase A-like enzyme
MFFFKIIAGSIFILASIASANSRGFADSPPNILLIYTDDQRFDTIHALGNDEIQTPCLDQLVARGMTFTNAYCQGGASAAVCVPSRVQLLSGRSTFRTPNPKEPYDGATLGKSFRAAGYQTVAITKPGNSFASAHSDFESLHHIPHVGMETNERCATKAIECIKGLEPDKPFFLYFAPSMPHDPRTAEARFHELYSPTTLTLSDNFMQEVPIDFGVLKIRDEQLAKYPRDPIEMREHLAAYYACITSLDYHLNRVIQTLSEQNRLENTFIVFSSDQGLAVGGRHGLMGKQNLYEHFKSPLIIAGPKVRQGRSDALVYLFDLFPTLCEFAGIPIPDACEGKSLATLCRSDASTSHRDFLFARYMDTQRMVRDQRWKLLWYPQINAMQLFDLENDPHELLNLAMKPDYAAVLRDMKQAMGREQIRFGDSLAPMIP